MKNVKASSYFAQLILRFEWREYGLFLIFTSLTRANQSKCYSLTRRYGLYIIIWFLFLFFLHYNTWNFFLGTILNVFIIPYSTYAFSFPYMMIWFRMFSILFFVYLNIYLVATWIILLLMIDYSIHHMIWENSIFMFTFLYTLCWRR